MRPGQVYTRADGASILVVHTIGDWHQCVLAVPTDHGAVRVIDGVSATNLDHEWTPAPAQ